MKILHVIPSVNAAEGGPIEGIKQLASAVHSTGNHSIEVATVDDPNATFLADFPLPVHPLGPQFSAYGYSPHLVPWLKTNAARFDIVVVNGIWRYPGFAVWRTLRRSSTPYVVFTHGMLDPWFKKQYPLKHLKKLLYWPWADYRVLRDAAAVLFTCEEERLLARRSFALYSARERVVGYGTSLPPVPPPNETALLLSRFPGLKDKRLALFMGRIHPKKGCDLVVRAFAQVLSANPAWHLVMAGPDQVGLSTDLKNLADNLNISDRITWTGMLTGHAKYSLIRASEFLILPSHQENFGIVVAEAMSCGVPPLISDKVNIWREVERDGAGIISSDDFHGACQLLNSWLALSEEERGLMREKARRSFESRFEIHAAAAQLTKVFSEITCLQSVPALNATLIS
jgi:glycosyltransferase involved in cell wall biosynthesis